MAMPDPQRERQTEAQAATLFAPIREHREPACTALPIIGDPTRHTIAHRQSHPYDPGMAQPAGRRGMDGLGYTL